MIIEEVRLPVIIEDFEEGDLVWEYVSLSDITHFGIIESIEADTIIVIMDMGHRVKVPFGRFKKEPKPKKAWAITWGKSLDITQVKEGSMLSIDYHGSRIPATVQSLSADKIVLVTTDHNGEPEMTEWDLDDQDTLNFVLRNWELEG